MTVTLRPGKPASVIGKFMLNARSHTFKTTGITFNAHDEVYEMTALYNFGTELVSTTFIVKGDKVTGSCSPSNGNSFKIELFRNAFTGATPVDGYYTIALPSLDGVAGSGYLTLTVGSKGAIKGAGRLGDGTTRTFSTTLIAVPTGFTNTVAGESVTTNSKYVAIIEALPASYKDFEGNQGYLFGLVELYKASVTNKTVIRLENEEEPIEWVNWNPKATEVYDEGFCRALGVSGGFYNKSEDLKAHYSNAIKVGNLPEVAELAFTYKNGSVSEPASAQATYWNPGGLVLTGFVAPAADAPKKNTGTIVFPDVYDYTVAGSDGIANDTGLKFSYTQATGLFRGIFNVYYDYVTAVNETTGAETFMHTMKKVTYQGVFLPVRADLLDGFEGRGYFLMGDKANQYNEKVEKYIPYNFNWSYDFSLTK